MATTSKWLEKFNEKKSTRLGVFSGSMIGATVALHGLSLPDALNLVQRKIERATRAGGTQVRIVHEKNSPKLRSALFEYLSHCSVVEGYEEDEDNPCAILVKLI